MQNNGNGQKNGNGRHVEEDGELSEVSAGDGAMEPLAPKSGPAVRTGTASRGATGNPMEKTIALPVKPAKRPEGADEKQ